MPRETKTVFSLPITEVQLEMLSYVLEQAAMSEMPGRWCGAARRLKTLLLSRDPDPNVRRVLDVSTGHLTGIERERLRDAKLVNQTMDGIYGGMIYVSELDTAEARPDGMSDTLWAIVEYASLRGCAYILFDRDGPVLRGFPVFETEDVA